MHIRIKLGLAILCGAGLAASFLNPTPGVFEAFDAYAMMAGAFGVGLLIGALPLRS